MRADDQTRVEPSAEHGTERDVAHQPEPNGLLQPVQQPLCDIRSSLEPWCSVDGSGYAQYCSTRVPVASTTSRWPGSSFETPAAASRAREEPEREVGIDRLVVERRRHEAAREHALQLRAEDDQVADLRIVERLDPEPVARKRRRAGRRPSQTAIPNLPSQPLRERVADLLVEMRDDLGIAPRLATGARRPRAHAGRSSWL